MAWITKRRIGKPNRPEKQIDTHDSKWDIFYQDKRWKKLRNWWINNHPLCEECLFNGISTPAEHVHHRIPFSTGTTMDDKFALLLDPDNLESVCRSCHLKIHNKLNHSVEQ